MTIGIVGAGQLGRMMALAGYPLGFDFLFVDRDAQTPGGQVGPILAGELTDRNLLGQLSESCEVLTFDWENIPVEALDGLPGKARIAPPLRALAAAQDRLSEKRTFELLGIATTRYASVDSRESLELAVKSIGLPGVLKTRRMGYDGKGQFVLRKPADLDRAWEALGKAPLSPKINLRRIAKKTSQSEGPLGWNHYLAMRGDETVKDYASFVANSKAVSEESRVGAKNLVAVLRDESPQEYRHKNQGAVAGIGLYEGVFQKGGLAIKGLVAWFMHRGYHGFAMPMWERKIRVFGNWIINFLTRRDLVGIPARDTPRAAFEEFASRPKG